MEGQPQAIRRSIPPPGSIPRFLRENLALVAAVLLGILMVRRAWLCDDAYITFRVVDNFLNGYGLTWNVVERVQVYTHPLWMFLLSLTSGITREFYFTPLFLSIALSLTALILLVQRLSLSKNSIMLGLLILGLSGAFMDYTTSGLENPLSYLLVVVFYAQLFCNPPSQRRLGQLSLTASLGILNRMDLGLVFLPALFYAFFQVRSWKSLLFLIMGQLPFLGWTVFSIWYYGFPFPNTAYAKLNTGIGPLEYIQQGQYYFLYTLQYDPLTLLGIFALSLAPLASRDRRTWLPVAGAWLYLAYILQIGGDFMGGRFFTVPLLCVVISLARAQIFTGFHRSFAAALTAILVTGLLFPAETTLSLGRRTFAQEIQPFFHGIANERDFYAPGTSLMKYRPGIFYPDFPWMREGLAFRQSGRTFTVKDSIGMFGFFAGPDVYIVDLLALSDPLLARLPIRRDEPWRIGHFERSMPAGYWDSARYGDNRIEDPQIHALYDDLLLITRGDLFSIDRFTQIIRVNLGQ